MEILLMLLFPFRKKALTGFKTILSLVSSIENIRKLCLKPLKLFFLLKKKYTTPLNAANNSNGLSFRQGNKKNHSIFRGCPYLMAGVA
jgi:hypothetical protein